MIKYLIIIIIYCSILCSYGQSTKDKTTFGFIIDPKIKTDVEHNISPSEFGAGQDDILIYNNRMFIDLYKNDKLNISLKEQNCKSSVFKSFYYWYGDTLGIDGAFGLFGGEGFSIQIIKGKATLYHMLASDEIPSYAYNEMDSLTWRLEIPCTNTKIILSEIPDSTKKQIVYGYVEFKSGDYYVSGGSVEGHEILPRRKQRANMRIYFKTAYFDIK